ncbi:hypothetical protein F4821DRAFT_170162 [Hypoxylon rubiginosum]|uniref:Uncharacterized protein n=1 Tax=Hypoxylon rubiginosum TaxID=110542 RepID=A0ACC0CWB7_9PEZI|nr:hypothetical protein F4821DRAFT_170162 [Hypoxylon rubiginosum]
MKTSVLLPVLFGGLVSGSLWAQFCDDTACNTNCGVAVNVGNPGCLSPEGNRKGIKIHGSNFPGHYLVFSPGLDCNCQNDCIDIPGSGAPSCIDITGNAAAQSFRFQQTTCKAKEGGPGTGNNCPPKDLLSGNRTVATTLRV